MRLKHYQYYSSRKVAHLYGRQHFAPKIKRSRYRLINNFLYIGRVRISLVVLSVFVDFQNDCWALTYFLSRLSASSVGRKQMLLWHLHKPHRLFYLSLINQRSRFWQIVSHLDGSPQSVASPTRPFSFTEDFHIPTTFDTCCLSYSYELVSWILRIHESTDPYKHL